jgi:methyl-accepting chemotaxis protein
VVAGEVKGLADQTARATEEISGQIAAVQTDTAVAVRIVRGIQATVGRVREITAAIADLIAAAVETDRMAETVSGIASGVQEESGTLRKQVVRFLAGVHVA